jgi:transposase-like protein
VPHRDEGDPPRRRANKVVGHGTWERDRPPVCGTVGREGGQARLHVEHRTDRATLEGVVIGSSREGAMVYSDEWRGYAHLEEMGRGHATVCHTVGEWARDDDGDGIREVHDNTLEGMWTGLRNHLRTFRGVNKEYLHQYVAIFEWSYNVKRATPEFLRALLGSGPRTIFRT